MIAASGPLPFPVFMETALYHPQGGYYARGPGQVGREGDFFTSVSVGPLFGKLLARRFLNFWDEVGKPAHWRVIECGAHDGTLAADIIGSLQSMNPQAFCGLEYAICEPLPGLRAAQHAQLRDHAAKVRIVANPAELATSPLPGLAFGNEVLDALPFHVVEWQAGRWLVLAVATGPDDSFAWEPLEIQNPALLAALEPLGSGFPDGYRSEVRTALAGFLAPLAHAFPPGQGLMIWIDYGYSRPDYYHPNRSTGTLRTWCHHHPAENPLDSPGQIDISAHVDFTAVASAAIRLGGLPLAFEPQGSWLTRHGRDWLLSMEGRPDPKSLRQFQTLTHPGQLGGSFHVLELTWQAKHRSTHATQETMQRLQL
jgi:SAM-dependent MidA family methyltransferase